MGLTYSVGDSSWTMLLGAVFFSLSVGVLFVAFRRHRSPSSPVPPGLDSHALLLQRFQQASRLAALVGIGVGLTVLVGGWFYGIACLKSIMPGAQTMKVNTALGLMLVGAALWLSGCGESKTGARRVAQILAGMAALIGLLTLLEHFTGTNLHIDEALVRDYTPVLPNPPGRMGATTAISFVLLGCALQLLKRRRTVVLSQFFAIAAGSLCIVNLVGYAYGIQYLGGIALYTAMAVHTSLTLLILSLGILCCSATEGLMVAITSPHLGGVLARRLLPAAVLVPIALGWLRWQGQLRGYYDSAFGVAIFASASVGVFVLLIWAHGGLLNRIDRERVESFESLTVSEAHFHQLADSMPQIVYSARADGWLDYCNQRWVDYTGLTLAQSQGWGSIVAIHPHDQQYVVEVWNRTLATGITYEIEFRLRRASDGAYRWHLGRGVPVRDDAGKIVKWFGTSTDIDDYKRAQQALEESRQQLELRVQERTRELERSNNLLHAILESMGDGVICVNEKYEHVLVNPAARKMLGGSPTEVSPDCRAEAFGLYHPDKRTLLTREELPLGRALSGEASDDVEIFGRSPQQADGAWFSCNSRPVKDGSGGLYGAVLVLRDITQRKHAEETQSRLLAILEETSDFVGTARPDGTIFYANRALRRLRGVSDEASVDGMRIEGTYPPRVVEQILRGAVQSAVQRGSWRGESVLRYCSGEEIPVSQLIMSHRNRDGEVEFMSTIARDISEIKDKEAKLKLVQKQLEASLESERELSRLDPLTRLANRRAFREVAEAERERGRRYSRCFSLAYLDLDGFKKINDTLGHSVGDEVLVAVAKVLRYNLRACDIVARLGGDEFAILLPEMDPSASKAAIDKVQHLLRSEMKAKGWPIDFSIGLASFLNPPDSIDHMIQTADELMYTIKTNGKGNVAAAVMG